MNLLELSNPPSLSSAYTYFFRSNRRIFSGGWGWLISVAFLQLIQRVLNIAPILLGVIFLQSSTGGFPFSLYGQSFSFNETVVAFIILFSILGLLSSTLSRAIRSVTALLEKLSPAGSNSRKHAAVLVSTIDLVYFALSATLLAAVSLWAPVALLLSGLVAIASIHLVSKFRISGVQASQTQVYQLIGFGFLVLSLTTIGLISGEPDVALFLLAAVIGRFAIGRAIRGHLRVLKVGPGASTFHK